MQSIMVGIVIEHLARMEIVPVEATKGMEIGGFTLRTDEKIGNWELHMQKILDEKIIADLLLDIGNPHIYPAIIRREKERAEDRRWEIRNSEWQMWRPH